MGGRQPTVPELMSAWQEMVPEGMKPTLEMLKGEALVIGGSLETWGRQFTFTMNASLKGLLTII